MRFEPVGIIGSVAYSPEFETREDHFCRWLFISPSEPQGGIFLRQMYHDSRAFTLRNGDTLQALVEHHKINGGALMVHGSLAKYMRRGRPRSGIQKIEQLLLGSRFHGKRASRQ